MILILLMLCVLGGCNSIEKTLGKVAGLYSDNKTALWAVSVTSQPNSNSDLPVSVDLVFIFDQTVNPSLVGLSGPQWFADKARLMLNFDQQLAVAAIEVVPDTLMFTIKLPEGYRDAVKVLLFANFVSKPGQYVADISRFNQLHITLTQIGYQLKEVNP